MAYITLWTIIILLSAGWNFHEIRKNTNALALKEARSHFKKDQAFRLWATTHGGVYVPSDKRTPPNRNLSHIPDRDIITSTGKKLTLMNPAYMLRQMMDEYSELYGVKGHITSLKLFNPNNTPDEWERSALKAFEAGKTELTAFIDIKGEPYFRLMQPMFIKQGCLKCHGYQNYKIGDVRGGVGVSIPIQPYLTIEHGKIKQLVYWHFILWLLVTAGIYAGFKRLKYHFTERLISEEALRQNEKLFRTMIKKSPLPMVITDNNQDISFYNDKFTELFGYTIEDMSTSQEWWETGYPDEEYRETVKNSWQKAIEKAEIDKTDIEMQEWDLTIKDRTKRRCEFYMVPLNDLSLIVMTDITNRKQVENELKKKTHDIGERNKELKCLYDTSTFLEKTNISVDEIYQSITNFLPPAWQYPEITCSRIIIDDNQYKTINFQETQWKQFSNIVINNNTSGTVEVYYSKEMPKNDEGPFLKEERDLINEIAERISLFIERRQTEEKSLQLETQLRQSQKIESIGRLAGGVAHDYNNALSVIIGNTEIAIDDVEPDEPVLVNLNEILMAANHAADITRQLLTFARKQTISPKALNINSNIQNTLKMLKRLIGEDIDLVWLPETDLWTVRMDAIQVDQILVNLCINARDAIAGIGEITIETKNVSFDDAFCKDHAGFESGDFILLTIRDNGCGMEKAILDSIFEPFFTTKAPNEGTGLGLSTVYGIVQQNKGFINISSKPNVGTTVNSYLPRNTGSVIEYIKEKTPQILPGNGETVLVVEDEVSILNLTRKILIGLGYTVLTESSPQRAITLADEHKDEINLLITDVIMPEMNGLKLEEHIKSIFPNLNCIFMSGYTADVISNSNILIDGTLFLQKPFSKKDLAELVRKALDK